MSADHDTLTLCVQSYSPTAYSAPVQGVGLELLAGFSSPVFRIAGRGKSTP